MRYPKFSTVKSIAYCFELLFELMSYKYLPLTLVSTFVAIGAKFFEKSF